VQVVSIVANGAGLAAGARTPAGEGLGAAATRVRPLTPLAAGRCKAVLTGGVPWSSCAMVCFKARWKSGETPWSSAGAPADSAPLKMASHNASATAAPAGALYAQVIFICPPPCLELLQNIFLPKFQLTGFSFSLAISNIYKVY